jgi:hypothetical protein
MDEDITDNGEKPIGADATPFADVLPLRGNAVMAQALSSVWNYHYEPNQLYHELANVMSMSPFDGTVSGSRKQMFGASHLSQCLVINKPTPRRIQTGAEIQYGRATFSTKVERDCRVLSMIPFYNKNTIGAEAIHKNPETMVLVEYADNGEIDCIPLRDYFSNHQYFGFRYQTTEKGRYLHGGVNGTALAAGDILQDSPSKRPDGSYCYGINLNVLFGSFPEVAEDGVVLSEEAVEWLKIRKYEKRTVAYGSTHFPINLYGDENNYKPFPEIGDYVRADGLLMALRSYDESNSPVEMSLAATREVNYIFDKLTYVPSAKVDRENGLIVGRGRVIDIRVSHDCSRQPYSPEICNTQALKYDRAAREFYREIMRQHNVMKANRPKGTNGLKVSHNFKNLLKHAHAMLQQESPSGEDQKVQMIYRASPMDDFTIEFVVEYEATPTEGYKLTDCWGGKGVVVKIVPREDMPVDAAGNRAHVLMDGGATVSRQNLGRLYEQFYNACSRDLTKEFCDNFSAAYPETHGQKIPLNTKMNVEAAYKKNDPAAVAAWERLMRYLSVVVPEQGKFYREEEAKGLRGEHMVAILEDGIYLHHPSNNDPELPDVVDILAEEFMPHISPVTYRDNSGEFVTTKDPMLIGEVYFILLEKTGDDWTSVPSGKLQNFGILSHINNQDKYASPWRQQAIRAWGETETAIGVSYMGTRVMAEIMDRNNNIATHRFGIYSILRASKPTDIPVLVDRAVIPLGSAKPLELVNHLALCNGWQFSYQAYQEMEPKPAALRFAA